MAIIARTWTHGEKYNWLFTIVSVGLFCECLERGYTYIKFWPLGHCHRYNIHWFSMRHAQSLFFFCFCFWLSAFNGFNCQITNHSGWEYSNKYPKFGIGAQRETVSESNCEAQTLPKSIVAEGCFFWTGKDNAIESCDRKHNNLLMISTILNIY